MVNFKGCIVIYMKNTGCSILFVIVNKLKNCQGDQDQTEGVGLIRNNRTN